MLFDSESVFENATTSEVASEKGKELGAAEKAELSSFEDTIQSGLRTAFEIGSALRAINESRLYREQYDTFDEYVAQRWDMGRGFAYGLMSAASIRDTLAAVYTVLPENEFQTRPLAKFEPDQQAKAWGHVVESAAKHGKPITNKMVKQIVEDLVDSSNMPGISTPVDEVDATGPRNEYRFGDPRTLLGEITMQSADLLLISDLPGSTPISAVKHLGNLLDAAAPVMNADHQVLVFSAFHDDHPLIAAAEKHGYESGVPIQWVTDSQRSPVPWSAKQSNQAILHFRKGSAGLAEQITNVIECASELFKTHPSQKPLALVRTLVKAATKPGMLVIDPTAGAASTNIACRQINRDCIGIESDPEIHAAGVDRLRELDGL